MEKENIFYLKGIQFYFEKREGREIEKEEFDTIRIKLDQGKESLHYSDEIYQNMCIEAFIILCIPYNKNSFFCLEKQFKSRTITSDILENESFQSFYSKLYESSELISDNHDLLEARNNIFNIIAGKKEDLISKKAGIVFSIDKDREIELCYSQSYVSSAYMYSFAEGLKILLKRLIDNPDEDMRMIPFVEETASQSLIEFGTNRAEFDFTKPIYELFMVQARLTPDKTAYYCIDDKMTEHCITYKDLDRKSSILAKELQRIGITTGKVAGVYIDRSIQYIISLLGIWKAGGIYLPLDMTYPSNYLKIISKEADIQAVLIDGNYRNMEFPNIKVVDVNKSEGEEDFQRFNTIEDPAFLMYTSGSTGKPKGVLHKQLQVINRMNFMWSKYPFQDGDVMAQRTTVNYMPSMWEFFGGLLKGVPTVIFSDRVTKDPDLLLEFLYKYKVSYFTFVPSLFQMMRSAGGKLPHLAKAIRCWISCGEPMTLDIFNTVKSIFPESVLINDYGATEVNGILYYDSTRRNEKSVRLPMFRPISNADIYLFDEYMRQVPLGMPGGIYVGGKVISIGYIESEELNKEKFVLNPLRGHEGEVLFKLGDRAVFHKDGKLEVLGRNDFQVKIRGIRMNINGIERMIEAFDKVRHVVVVVKQQTSSNKYMAAYLEMKEETAEEELRRYLEDNIPRYMMPAQFYFIDKIPLLPNGKADRRKLEAMSEKGVADVETQKEENTIKYRKIMIDLVSDILGISAETIKTRKKYYELGFDSVSIVELLKQMNEKLGTNLTLAELYDNSCIDDLVKNCFDSIEAEKKENSKAISETQPEIVLERTYSENEKKINQLICEVTGFQNYVFPVEGSWDEAGLSLNEKIELTSKIKDTFDVQLSLLQFTDTGNIETLAKEIDRIVTEKEKQENEKTIVTESVEKYAESQTKNNGLLTDKSRKVAVIGMSCHYPCAKDKEQLWENLVKGMNSISEIPEERWDYKKFYSGEADSNELNVKWGGFLDDISTFDFKYFGISSKEARLMDPQQKICLEEAYHAFEDAGYAISDLNGKDIGVFIGARTGDYQNNLKEHQIKAGGFAFMGNDSAIISARISYLLNLHGPCMTIDTACSSSLYAIHQAINAILLDDCDTAVSGGTFVMNSEYLFENSAQMGMLSKEGRCKTFDDGANGFVPAEGSGIVILKEYQKAVADGDRIYGVILASGSNQDGKTNGITAPSSEAQYKLEKKVYERASINPKTISYVETHGTGTKLGDPIEVEALQKTFKEWTDKKYFCALGSIKTNIGHSVTSSGVAGLIKVMLCMQHELLPKNLNFEKCNSYINLDEGPFYLLEEAKEWKRKNGMPRRAALSSFGFGGSNCHMVIEDYAVCRDREGISEYLMVLSAHSKEALLKKAEDLEEWMLDGRNRGAVLGDISCTLAAVEKYPYRVAFLIRSKQDMIAYLEVVNRQIKHYMVHVEENKKDSLLQNEELGLLKEDYLKGLGLERYKRFLQEKGYGIISLPPYPYQKEACYLDHAFDNETDSKNREVPDYHILDHVLNGEALLPGTAFLDMMCQDYKKNRGDACNIIKNICFQNSGRQGEEFEFQAEELREGAAYKIYGRERDIVFATGEVGYENPAIEQIDVEGKKRNCSQKMSRRECYEEFTKMDLNYGRFYSLIEEIFYNNTEALSRIKRIGSKKYEWNPSILDAAFQSVVPLLNHLEEHENKFVPYTVKKVLVNGDLENVCYIYAVCVSDLSKYALQKFDLKLMDSQGMVVAVMEGFTRKKVTKDPGALHVFVPEYKNSQAEEKTKQDGYLLMIGTKENLYQNQDLYQAFSGKIIRVVQEDGKDYDYHELFRRLSAEGKFVEKILYLASYHASEAQSEKILYSMTSLMQGLIGEMKGKDTDIICIYDGNRKDSSYYEALAGFGLSVQREYSNVYIKMVDLSGYTKGSTEFCNIVTAEILNNNRDVTVTYENGSRLRKTYRSHRVKRNLDETIIREHGVYVITGGLGGIGIALARYLLFRHDISLVLLGRRNVSEEEISVIFNSERKPVYDQADVGSKYFVEETLEAIENRYGTINGVFHCAGVAKDCMLKNKKRENMQEVISTKVDGMISLERYLKKNPSCFLVCFSSIAAITGNAGQTDYAYANGFMDAEVSKCNSDRIYSYDWALWSNGQMGNTSYIKDKMREEFGLLPIENGEGFEMMFNLMGSEIRNAVITKGNTLNRLFPKTSVKDIHATKEMKVTVKEKSIGITGFERELERIAKEVFEKEQFQRTSCFEDDDFDSISLMEFASAVTSKYGVRISAALLFEYNTIEKLAAYISGKKVKEPVPKTAAGETAYYENAKPAVFTEMKETGTICSERIAPLVVKDSYQDELVSVQEEVAVVGISGRFPGADNVEEFWCNLMSGTSSIIETPKERWDIEQFEESIQSYVRYGGFIKDIKEFDPLYFHISPAEAKLMDPQQRLLLQETVKCLAYAGIDKQEISGKKISVYIGAFSNDYLQIVNRSESAWDPNVIAGNDHAMMANRISYFFNLKGNSEAVDTACSSSLACVLKAVKEIRSGICEGAIVGGVNLILVPEGSIRVGNLGFLSEDSAINSFTEKADGYVRGEGVGVMYLKSLRKAVEDQNQILAVIKGGAVNHNGKGHYLMEPNAFQEAEVIKAAYRDAGVSIGTVNYIEAHGTGTRIGDENEIYAYKKAFKDLESESQTVLPQYFCGIGTVKPNIGHLEAASGMASMIKLILSLYKKEIPATLLHGQVNPEFGLEESCFYIQNKNSTWETISDLNGVALPRRGEVHAYGYGGTNAHLILEEYIENSVSKETKTGNAKEIKKMIFPLSANTDDSLAAYVRKYQSFIEQLSEEKFMSLSYSMQRANLSLSRRAAFIADNKEELLELLRNYTEGVWSPFIRRKMGEEVNSLVTDIFSNQSSTQVIEILKRNQNYAGIASLWANGLDLDWNKIFNCPKSPGIFLPSYPFEKEICWVEDETNTVRPVILQQVKRKTEETGAEQTLKQMIANCLEISKEQVENHKKLSEIGMNSIMLAKLKFRLEESYEIQLKTVELAAKETVSEMNDYINEKINKRTAE